MYYKNNIKGEFITWQATGSRKHMKRYSNSTMIRKIYHNLNLTPRITHNPRCHGMHGVRVDPRAKYMCEKTKTKLKNKINIDM